MYNNFFLFIFLVMKVGFGSDSYLCFFYEFILWFSFVLLDGFYIVLFRKGKIGGEKKREM